MARICNYEGSHYRTEFWQTNRQYEDMAERIAMKAMLPPTGDRIVEIGAGFGRLVDLYQGYRQVVLVDYARTQLEEARRYLPPDDRFIFVVGDVYNLPFVDNLFNSLVMVRVMHHLENVPAALHELQRILCPTGTAVIEHASKRHLKSVIRWLLQQQDWNPFSPEPHEFVEMNIDFHPAWMRRQFQSAGLAINAIRTVSHFRSPIFKKFIPASWLAVLDGLAQPTGRWWQYSPSIFLRAVPQNKPSVAITGFFKCPACGSHSLQPESAQLVCLQCHAAWPVEDNIYDFKTPVLL